MSDELDFSKPEELQVRDRSEFRIYATDHCGLYPVVGGVKGPSGWHYQMWDKRGHLPSCNTEHPLDLIRKPRRITGWLNCYEVDGFVRPRFGDSVFATKEEASRNKVSTYRCIGQIYIDAEIQT